jgi:hypothetical protein
VVATPMEKLTQEVVELSRHERLTSPARFGHPKAMTLKRHGIKKSARELKQ